MLIMNIHGTYNNYRNTYKEMIPVILVTMKRHDAYDE